MDEAAAGAPRSARKPLRYALAALSTLAFVLAALVAYLALTFDPRVLHPYAIEFVREKSGRTLEIRGDTALTFWPDVGVRLNGLALSERGRPEIFANADAVRVTLKLLPLLKGEIVATELAIAGAELRIVRDREGRLNIADLLEGEGGETGFDIGRLAIERSRLTYHDLATGARSELGALALKTGRLADGAASPFSLSAVLRDERHAILARLRVDARLELDLDRRRYTLVAANLEANGDYADDAIALTLAASRIVFGPGSAEGEAMRLTLLAKGRAGATDAKLDLPVLKVDGSRAHAGAAALDVAIQRGEHRVNVTLATPLEVVLATREVHFNAVDASFAAHGPQLPRSGVTGALKGEARLDAAEEGVAIRLAGSVADSRVELKLMAAGFASPVYTFAAEVDRLDLDRYARGSGSRASASVARAQHLLEPLDGLRASGTLTIGILTAGKLKAANVKLALR